MASLLHHRAEKLASSLPPLLIDAERVAQSVWQGVHGRRRAGVGESFWQFRRYNPGDAAERIDWRQSSRTDHIYIREREWEAAQTACLWADPSGSMRYASAKNLPAKADAAQLLMLALASLLLRGGEKTLWSEGKNFTPVNGKAALERVAENLAGKRYNTSNNASMVEAESLSPLPPKLRHAHMILASDFLMPPEILQQRMQAYAAQNLRGALLHIVDPLEASFNLAGRVELQGMEGEASILIPSAASLHDAYGEKFAEHQAQLQKTAASAGWFYLRHVTSEAAGQTLLRLYQYLAG